ncbi:MAG: hypothetical protein H5U40_09755, partial [Polyangiaceae bacterium]|nr:hypothetical protein [Polyangiaceae bacterium]
MPLILGALAVVVINFVLTAVPSMVVLAVFPVGILSGIVASLVSGIISVAITGVLWGGLYTMAGKAYMSVPPELSDLGIATKNGRLMEYVTVGAVIASPALLNVIPFLGALLAPFVSMAVMFLFIPAMIMVAEGLDAKTALARSKELTTTHTKEFAITYVVAGLISIFVITIPLGLLMILDTYFSLKNPQPGAGIEPPQQQYQPPPPGN